MKTILRRLQKLETRSGVATWSWTEEFGKVTDAALKKMNTEDLRMLEPVIGSMNSSCISGLNQSERTVLARWVATFDRTAWEMNAVCNWRDQYL